MTDIHCTLARSSPAPVDDLDDGMDRQQRDLAAELHALCEDWSAWCRTRRFFGRPKMPSSLLGRLTSRTRAFAGSGGPDGICSSRMAALHLAVLAQPSDALDRQVFELHYLWRVGNVSQAAAAMGISRQHWYRILAAFRQRVAAAAQEIEAANLHAASQLPHRKLAA